MDKTKIINIIETALILLRDNNDLTQTQYKKLCKQINEETK